MMKFSWGGPDRTPPVIEARFEGLPGYEAWRHLFRDVGNPEKSVRELFKAFDDFLHAIGEVDRKLVKTKCVFISHRRCDWSLAEDVATTVTNTGRDYWLDIHDPTLQWANGIAVNLGSVAGAILLAAIIEIALLNSTHVIALHTVNSPGSAWIPYELGRAKARKIFSSQAAGWFDSQTILSGSPEYVHLAHQTFSHADVEDWLLKRGRYA